MNSICLGPFRASLFTYLSTNYLRYLGVIATPVFLNGNKLCWDLLFWLYFQAGEVPLWLFYFQAGEVSVWWFSFHEDEVSASSLL